MAKGKNSKNPKSAATLAKRRLRERANGCVIRIKELIQDIPFENLTTAVFLFCFDIKTERFVHKYESQIELAGANPERFSAQLCDFFSQMAKEIRQEELYQEYFEFLGLCAKKHAQEEHPTEKEKVLNAYMTLLLHQMEYLRPSQYDFSSVVCGITTTGEVMTMPDYCPEFDLLRREVKAWRSERLKNSTKPITPHDYDQAVSKIFANWGYKVSGARDLERMSLVDDVFSTIHSILAQYINEYTFDMLPDPKNAFSAFALPFYGIDMTSWTSGSLVEMLKKRSRTLPTNGITFILNYKEIGIDYTKEPRLIEMIRMKEILYADRVIMLYRMWTREGELAGYYDTKEGFLFSSFFSVTDRSLYERVKTFILYFYASVVIRDGQHFLEAAGNETAILRTTISKEITPYTVKIFGENGKLINTYKKDGHVKTGNGPKKLRIGDPAYVSEVRPIQGFVRKVGVGKKPSQEAVARAASLGYDLAPDETYVQGFFRSVLKLKERN